MNQPPLNPDAHAEVARMRDMVAEAIDNPGESVHEFVSLPDLYQLLDHLTAALPEVTEREQLTALPDKIVLEDRRGTIWQKINGTWYTPGSKHDYSDQSVMLPARVMYRPGANDA